MANSTMAKAVTTITTATPPKVVEKDNAGVTASILVRRSTRAETAQRSLSMVVPSCAPRDLISSPSLSRSQVLLHEVGVQRLLLAVCVFGKSRIFHIKLFFFAMLGAIYH